MNNELTENYRYHRARGAPAWLAMTRARADLSKVPPKRRYGACKPAIAYSPRNAEGEGFVENALAHIRFVYADEVEGVRLNHTGWYCDEFQDRKLRGVVVRLSHGRCFPAYQESDNGGLLVDWSSPTKLDRRDDRDLRHVARQADSMAERAAEREREYNEAWQAGSRWADLGETIKDIRTATMHLTAHLRAIRHDPMPTVAAIIRESICEKLARIRKFRAERAKLANGWRGQLRDAFNEGAAL